MPAGRRYQVKGTKDFLILAGICFFICLWAIKDAWFPSPKVLKKHPVAIEVSFSVPGSLAEIHVQPGDSVMEKQVLAELHKTVQKSKFESAKADYIQLKKEYEEINRNLKIALKEKQNSDRVQKLSTRCEELKAQLEEAEKRAENIREYLAEMDLRSPCKGVVKKVLVNNFSVIKAGEPIMIIAPMDSFYLFNKSLTIVSFFLFWIFFGIHIAIS